MHTTTAVYSFWLFAFERLNGSYNTNCHHISVQLMKRFLDYHTLQPHAWPSEFSSEFISLIGQANREYSMGSLAPSTSFIAQLQRFNFFHLLLKKVSHQMNYLMCSSSSMILVLMLLYLYCTIVVKPSSIVMA